MFFGKASEDICWSIDFHLFLYVLVAIAAIARAGAHIWNPSPDLTLREADDVIFYGELEALNLRIRPLIRQTIEARMTSPEKPHPWNVDQLQENEAAWAAKAPEFHWRYRRR